MSTAGGALSTVEEYDACVQESKDGGTVLLLQLGSDACPKCPEFGKAIEAHVADFKFVWYYCDAHDSELPEHFGITNLPAYVLVSAADDEAVVVANATAEQLQEHMRAHCPRVLQLDADF